MFVKSYDVVAYDYQGEILCPDCTTRIVVPGADLSNTTEYDLDVRATELGIDRYDESTYDQSEFPKIVFADQVEDDVCGSCLVRI